jgi:hypothetical protein
VWGVRVSVRLYRPRELLKKDSCTDDVGSDSTDKSVKKQEEVASKKLILESTKKCPGCKSAIEKSWGCDHMRCKVPTNFMQGDASNHHTGLKCKKEFCWQCLAPFMKKGPRSIVHREGCKYYRPDWDPDSAD